MEHKQILKTIKAIRESFQDGAIIYMYGACYGFYEILKSIYPKATPYMDEAENHTLTKIDGKYYDVHGEYIELDGKVRSKPKKLNQQQQEYWETVKSGQRVEYMLKKYKKN